MAAEVPMKIHLRKPGIQAEAQVCLLRWSSEGATQLQSHSTRWHMLFAVNKIFFLQNFTAPREFSA